MSNPESLGSGVAYGVDARDYALSQKLAANHRERHRVERPLRKVVEDYARTQATLAAAQEELARQQVLLHETLQQTPVGMHASVLTELGYTISRGIREDGVSVVHLVPIETEQDQ